MMMYNKRIGGLNYLNKVICMNITKRQFGIADSLMDMANSRIEKSKDKEFKQMLDHMLATPNWSLRPWKATLETQLSSWKMYIPGVGSAPEMVEIKNFKTLLDTLKEEELDNPELINGPARERIARSSGKSVDDVGKLLYFYKQTKIVATWLQLKKSKKEKIPETQEEMQLMQETDTRLKDIAIKIMHTKKQRSGRGRGMPF